MRVGRRFAGVATVALGVLVGLGGCSAIPGQRTEQPTVRVAVGQFVAIERAGPALPPALAQGDAERAARDKLAERFDVVGVDVSRVQIRLARANVPKARFIEADIADVAFPDGSFDGVVAYYSISHVPRAEHAAIFERVVRWLVPGGLFLASLGATDSPDWVGTWLGVPMFFSAFDADRNRTLLQAAGFDLLIDEVVEIREPEGPATFLWVLAQSRVAALRRSPSR